MSSKVEKGKKSKKSKPKGTSPQTSAKDLTNEEQAYDAIFEGDFGSLEIGSYIGGVHEGATEHLPDAVDFEDEDELADEELPEEEPADFNQINSIGLDSTRDADFTGNNNEIRDAFFETSGNEEFLDVLPQEETDMLEHNISTDGFQGGNNALFMEIDNSNVGYMDQNQPYGSFMEDEVQKEREQQQSKIEAEKLAKEEKQLLKSYFPEFEKGKTLRWNKLLYRKRSQYHWQRELLLANRVLKPLIPLNLKFQVQTDQRRIFKSSDSIWQNSLVSRLSSVMMPQKAARKGIINVSIDELYPEKHKEEKQDHETYTLSEELLIATDDWDPERIIGDSTIQGSIRPKGISDIVEETARDWDWQDDDLINAHIPQAEVAELDMNDNNLLLIQDEQEDSSQQQIPLALNEKSLLDKFNISNDEQYSILIRKHQTKVRATVSNLNIEHSQPATRLQTPYYKVNVPRQQLRHFHRPNFGSRIRPGTNIVFSKLKTRKRRRDKGKDVKESFASSQDLTTGDTAPVYLMEYSEETPIALSKFGMANKLINYYRKMHEQDTTRPKLPVGETHVLGVQDKSPFWNFGFVEPGHIVPTLYNNMIRAPVFKHDVPGTDFLIIRSSGCGTSNRFFLRPINHLFAVGQTFPVDEIPGPNSRKVTSMRMTRLRMIVYRILNKTPSKAISLDPIARHFPDQDYGQSRQKVKEFMKYQRDGTEKGLWKLKDGEPLLDNENTKKLITPEQVAEVESMNSGIIYKEDNDLFNFDEKLVKLEENLLPWNIARNFINATQMRAMIQIHGVGDPTGIGEGFSFLKTSMKGGFLKGGMSNEMKSSSTASFSSGHTYNVAQQQKIYAEEIRKKWYTNAKSLTITNPFEEMNDPNEVNQSNRNVRVHRDDKKVLKIVRKKRDENGVIQRQTVIIKDPRIIKGYLKGKELRTQAKLDVNTILKEDILKVDSIENIELQKKLLQNELANLEKSQQRRVARQNKDKMESGPDGTKPGGKGRKRRCATCGQVGHIRTNKSCPMYNGADLAAGSSTQSLPTKPPTTNNN
ncbi:hypothetical protein Kpol_513p21 [Vanderwaltozyma polyspora DSM 70294]|uniref:Transcription initiation factor TFIID subunit 1 histone acetyltransferase domain-containing protein n=1 Tax=Vanderwaltozyma polyspora (strain ATCC 22028 / DSM 70294 / BCRC 21397 / CBS 2163 / NBRC 10782 / NRRL Y-8283 / UCD 57-17) TaxID=436907 RepID=A7TMK7_VANPO|nr:uncharacterized protein Kpol_513p21 [Vanderwaltozyma polyspora DSM 70294]EDO16505.1 hypothetical protein Kpol_513p21 [Vanderwaltozyma polyspora DSM 70294]